MARTIKKLASGSGTSTLTYVAPSSVGPGKLRIIQIIFGNNSGGSTTFSAALGGSYEVSGNPITIIPQFSLLSKTYRVLNVNIPLLAGDDIAIALGHVEAHAVIVGEETD